MPDLHARLLDAIERREAIAREASPGPWLVINPNEGTEYSPLWQVVNDAWLNADSADADERRSDIALDLTLHTGVREDVELVALHDPADALRRYAHYRRVLERHHEANGVCDACSSYGRVGLQPWSREVAWPCIEVRDVLDALGIEVSHDGQ